MRRFFTLITSLLAMHAYGQNLEVSHFLFISNQTDTVQAEPCKLSVPENRTLQNSKTFDLSFVRFKSTNPNPGSSIIYMAAGPGGSGIVTAKGKRLAEIKLQDYFRELKTVEVNIDGENYNFLFDTGGGATVVSPQIIEKLGRDIYGYNVGFRMSGERVVFERCDNVTLAMGGILFHQEEVAVFDLMELLPKGLGRVDGVISLKTFKQSEITLDLKYNRIIIETEKTFQAKTKKMTEVESRFANGLAGDDLNIFLALRANGKKWWFLFDSGNIADMKISKAIASSWKSHLPDDTTMAMFTYHFGGKARDSNMYIDDIIYDGALNFHFLQAYQFAISLKYNQVFISEQ